MGITIRINAAQIGPGLKWLRGADRLEDASLKIGRSVAHISSMENMKKPPSVLALYRYAEAYGPFTITFDGGETPPFPGLLE